MNPIKIEGCGGMRDCKNLPAEELHSCPYEEDINGNYENVRKCCEDCMSECAADI